jgi:hypothetical protein
VTETNVERAVRSGADEEQARAWCAAGLAPIFGGAPRRVAFTGYFACVKRGRERSL